MLSRDEILRSATRRYATVKNVPGWGDVRIQSLTETERWNLIASQADANGKVDRSAVATRMPRLLVMVVVDDEGNRVFQDDDWKQLEFVEPSILRAVFEIASVHAGTVEGKPSSPAGEEEQKKTDSSTNGDSPGSSPETTPPGPSDC